MDALLRLKAAQEALVKTAAAASLGGEDERTLAEHKKALAETCVEAAGRFASFHDFENALRFFDEASRHDPGNVAVMAQVAGLKLNALGDVDGAEKDLRAILRLDAEHEEANFMLAELMFVREDVDGALFHVRESMRLNPRQFGSLARLCRLLHRAGASRSSSRSWRTRRSFGHGDARTGGGRASQPRVLVRSGPPRSLAGDSDRALASLSRCRADAASVSTPRT